MPTNIWRAFFYFQFFFLSLSRFNCTPNAISALLASFKFKIKRLCLARIKTKEKKRMVVTAIKEEETAVGGRRRTHFRCGAVGKGVTELTLLDLSS